MSRSARNGGQTVAMRHLNRSNMRFVPLWLCSTGGTSLIWRSPSAPWRRSTAELLTRSTLSGESVYKASPDAPWRFPRILDLWVWVAERASPAFARTSSTARLLSRITSASVVVGPLAPSRANLVLSFYALAALIWPSSAARTGTSDCMVHQSSVASTSQSGYDSRVRPAAQGWIGFSII